MYQNSKFFKRASSGALFYLRQGLVSFFPVSVGILVMGEDSLDADGAGGFIDREVGGIGKAVEHSKADVVEADGPGKGVLFDEGELLLQIEVEPSAEAFGAAIVIIDRLLDLPVVYQNIWR